MPYTPVHVLVALPFLRRDARPSLPADVRRWAVPALLAGSMVPDTPNFLDVLWPGAAELGHLTHDLRVALTIDVALALAFAALWVLVVGPAFLAALPRRSPVPGRAPGPVLDAYATRGRTARALTVVAYAVAGILTHVAWDDLTHRRGYTVQAWDLLREPLAGRPLYVYLQHGSSALGVLAFLAVTVWWWRRARPVESPRHLRSGLLSVLGGAGLGVLGAAARLSVEPGGVTLYALARRSATYPVLGAALALVAWAVVLRVRRGNQDPEPVAAPWARGDLSPRDAQDRPAGA